MATIDYNSGNIDVTFFPTNTGSVRFCEKNEAGINIATNNQFVTSNTIKIGNSLTTTTLSGAVSAPTPATDALGTQVVTASWVRSFITTFLGAIQTFTLGLRLSTIYGKVTETAFALWTETAGSTIAIGNGSTITLNGTTVANTVSSSAVGTTLALGGNITTGSVEIGKNQTTGGTITVGSANSKTNVNGNFGIGTTSPAYTLDVSGTAQFTTSICNNATFGNWKSYYDVNGQGKNYSCLSTNTGGVGLYDFALYQDTASTTLNSAAILRFNIGDVEKMRLLTNGNFGIGTTAPAYKLDVVGDSKLNSWVMGTNALGTQLPLSNETYALYQESSGTYVNAVTNGNIGFRVNNDQKMNLLSSGNFGIGTNTPAKTLDVEGSVRFSATSSGHGLILKANTTGNVVDSGTAYDFQNKAPFYIHDSGFPVGSGMGMKMGIFRNSGYGYINVETGNTGGSYHLCLQSHSDNTYSHVGIGTANPAYKLDVAGTAQFTTAICNTVNSSAVDSTLALGGNITTGVIEIGKSQSGVGTLSIGATTNTSTTINGGSIKQVVPLFGGGTVETVIGDTSIHTPSMSTNFNRKNTTSLLPIACYKVNAPNFNTTQYFEIIVSGSNTGFGAYTYKGCFAISKPAGSGVAASSVITLFSFGGTPTITFTSIDLWIMSINVSTAIGTSSDQNFMTTLISYPTTSPLSGILYYDYSIWAV